MKQKKKLPIFLLSLIRSMHFYFFYFLLVRASVADPHHFAADPDHDFHFDADPDHDFQFDADPDPTAYFSPDLDPPMPQNWHSISMRFLS